MKETWVHGVHNDLPSWEAGSRGRSSVKCKHSSPCSSWPEHSCSALGFPFFPSRSFKIIYKNTKEIQNVKTISKFKDLHFFQIWRINIFLPCLKRQINLLKGCWSFHFGDLSLLSSLDTRCSGIQGIMRCRVQLLMALYCGRHAGWGCMEWSSCSNWREGQQR